MLSLLLLLQLGSCGIVLPVHVLENAVGKGGKGKNFAVPNVGPHTQVCSCKVNLVEKGLQSSPCLTHQHSATVQ